MGAFTKKSSFFGMHITEPTRYTNLSSHFEQLEDDSCAATRRSVDMQQAISDWK